MATHIRCLTNTSQSWVESRSLIDLCSLLLTYKLGYRVRYPFLPRDGSKCRQSIEKTYERNFRIPSNITTFSTPRYETQNKRLPQCNADLICMISKFSFGTQHVRAFNWRVPIDIAPGSGQEDYFRKNYFKEKHVRLDPHPQKNQDRNLNLESNDFTETFH